MKRRDVRALIATVQDSISRGDLANAAELLRNHGLQRERAVRVVARMLAPATLDLSL